MMPPSCRLEIEPVYILVLEPTSTNRTSVQVLVPTTTNSTSVRVPISRLVLVNKQSLIVTSNSTSIYQYSLTLYTQCINKLNTEIRLYAMCDNDLQNESYNTM